jgi:hypothetical protein
MQLRKLLERWDLTSLKIKAPFLDMEWQPRDEDKNAAWDLYVELITRVATQRLEPDEGDEAAALQSLHDLFELTRSSIKQYGRYCINFTRIAVVMLNQKVPRPGQDGGTVTVIEYFDGDPMVIGAEPHLGPGAGSGVLEHVGQCLLDDAVHG